MHELAREAWGLFNRAESLAQLVRPSMPILFFGDSEAYQHSERRVVTVGLNPSRWEFPGSQPFVRFPAAESLQEAAGSAASCGRYLEALNRYFCVHPYSAWFGTFEPLLQGFRCSFYPGSQNTALHTDLCSPLATQPTWSRLSNEQRAGLEKDGVELWHRLITHLRPQVILISVAAQHLAKNRSTPVSDWCSVYRLERNKPYEFLHRLLRIDSGAQAHLIFGRAAQKPFGTVSHADKLKIGRHLAMRLLEASSPTA
jgi:hypothetical protein